MAGSGGFASKSVARHVTRGVIGFGAIVAAFALLPIVGLWSLALAPVGLLALRGCPVCWILGMIETVSMGRLQRECVDGACQLRSH